MGVDKTPTPCYNKFIKRKELTPMKIFITRNHPTASFYYKVLRFLLDHGTRKEIDFYLDQLEGK